MFSKSLTQCVCIQFSVFGIFFFNSILFSAKAKSSKLVLLFFHTTATMHSFSWHVSIHPTATKYDGYATATMMTKATATPALLYSTACNSTKMPFPNLKAFANDIWMGCSSSQGTTRNEVSNNFELYHSYLPCPCTPCAITCSPSQQCRYSIKLWFSLHHKAL